MPRKIGNSNITAADLVVVNYFTFCKDHGEEYCPSKCQYDFRDMNNFVIAEEEEVVKASEENGIDLPSADYRPSINCYQLGAVPVDKDDPRSEACHCIKHKKLDCESCFNWVKLLLEAGRRWM